MMPADRDSRAEARIPAAHYLAGTYDSKGRFSSYWHQIHEVSSRGVGRLLEVGVGNRLVSEALGRSGIGVVTADINPNLFPDVTCSIEALPFADQAFDMVIACEVLEHLPLENLEGSLHELRRVAAKWVLLSLPNCTRCYCLQVPMPRLGLLRYQLELPAPPEHALVRDHHWEIGHAGVSKQQLIGIFRQTGFTVEASYRVFEHPYHHFFVLRR
jgi:hypothetical protein